MEPNEVLAQIEALIGTWKAASCFVTPDDLVGKVRVLRMQADNREYWVRRCTEAEQPVYRERVYQHLQRRLWALTSKLRGVRLSAAEYKKTKDFEQFHALRQRIAELEAQVSQLQPKEVLPCVPS